MADKFKPLYYNPHLIYDFNYWNIVAQDIYNFAWNSILFGFTGKFPPTRNHVIKFCGNPQCYSLLAFYPDERPVNCKVCKKIIDWNS
jgi:hypothetical protein